MMKKNQAEKKNERTNDCDHDTESSVVKRSSGKIDPASSSEVLRPSDGDLRSRQADATRDNPFDTTIRLNEPTREALTDASVIFYGNLQLKFPPDAQVSNEIVAEIQSLVTVLQALANECARASIFAMFKIQGIPITGGADIPVH
jgi:hypothetical protein